jgi:hypothetical protein
MLSHDFWHRYFSSDPSVLGTTAIVDGKQFAIIGSPEDMDAEMLAWLREAYRIGRQKRPRFYLHS